MLIQWAQWWTLACNDVRLRYRRTTLGPLWITVGLAATVSSVGLLYGSLFGNRLSDYLPYFATGLVVWAFIASAITEGCTVYLVAARLIRAVPVPIVVHVYRMLGRQIIVLAHNFLIVALLWMVFRWPLTPSSFLVIPGLSLNLLAVFGLVLFLSVVAARFRDVALIVTTFLQLVFLMTPIMWQTSTASGVSLTLAAYLNPIYHLIEVVRRPLLGEPGEVVSWGVAGFTAALSLAVGLAFHGRYRHRVPFWV